MSENYTIYNHYSTEDESFVKDSKNLLELSSSKGLVKVTNFIEPNKQKIIADLTRKYPDLTCDFYGVFDNAERKRALIYPKDYYVDTDDYLISVIELTYEENAKINHRDFLGALISAGIKREKLGDIIISDKKTYLALDSKLSRFVIDNLCSVGGYNVSVELMNDIENIKTMENPYEIIDNTVASLRLDAVVKIAFNMSRSKANDYIEKKLVKHNWNNNIKASQIISINDIISVRGKGKFKISEIQLNNKSQRYRISIKKYI